jgi:hypothetical protein
MKTNKLQTLLLVKAKEAVRAKDLVQAFGYSAPTARSYLSHLKRQDLLERIMSGHVLTEKGRPGSSSLTWVGAPIWPVRSVNARPATLPVPDAPTRCPTGTRVSFPCRILL